MQSATFDSSWERRYSENVAYRNRYPYSEIVSFVFRSIPKDRPRSAVRILEIGCGNGANLWFCVREGFQVAGIDGSATAIADAQAWFSRENLSGDFRVGDFCELPFADESFDLAFERAALSFTGRAGAHRAVSELWRVLVPRGKFHSALYSDDCTSRWCAPDVDGLVRDIRVGTIVGGSQTRFYSRDDVADLFSNGWRIVAQSHMKTDYLEPAPAMTHGEWQTVAEKTVRK